MKILITFGILFAGQLTGYAKIGETPEQCQKRYGEARDKSLSGSYLEFRAGDIHTQCWFTNGKCTAISYALAPRSIVIYADVDPRFSELQEQKLLAINSSSKWNRKDQKSESATNEIYQTEDGKMHALVNFTGVRIESIERYNASMAAASKAKIDETIHSFGN